jgi:hypothetical protein
MNDPQLNVPSAKIIMMFFITYRNTLKCIIELTRKPLTKGGDKDDIDRKIERRPNAAHERGPVGPAH